MSAYAAFEWGSSNRVSVAALDRASRTDLKATALIGSLPAFRKVRARAPLRLSFAGGGTDVAPFPETGEGGVVLSATIDRYAYGLLAPRTDDRVNIESVDFGMSLDFPVTEDPVLDGELDLVKAAIRRLRRGGLGVYDLVLRSNTPPGSGLGSSSTMMVALVGLLHEFYVLRLDPYKVAHLAYAIEREDLGIKGGYQDH